MSAPRPAGPQPRDGLQRAMRIHGRAAGRRGPACVAPELGPKRITCGRRPSPPARGGLGYTSPMPELPEVEAARRLLMRSAVGRRIVSARVVPDPIVYQGVSPARIRTALVGRRVLAAHRHGKHLWVELDRRPWPCFHFGMSGGIEVRGRQRQRLMVEGRRAREESWPPRFLKLHLTLDDGGEIVFRDARRLGRVRLRHDPAGRAAHQLARLRRAARPAAPRPAGRALRQACRTGQGGAARSVVLGGGRQLDRRRGALSGPHRSAPPHAHA